jgi:spore maturation protein CgeB
MLAKLDLFMPPKSQYSVLHHFTKMLEEALKAKQVDTQLLEAEWKNPKPFLEKLFQHAPDATVSFNGLLPDEEGRYFSEMVGIPHVACLVDSPYQFLLLARSPSTVITCTDEYACEFFKGIGARHVLFLPHAVEENFSLEGAKKQFDVVCAMSLIDYEEIQNSWNEKYPKFLVEAMNEAHEKALFNSNVWYVQAFVEALDHQMSLRGTVNPRKIDFSSVLDDLEMYIKGKSRVNLLRAVKDVKVELFGGSVSASDWNKYIKGMDNIVLHEPVPFTQLLDVFKQARIILNSNPYFRGGTHERVLYGMASEAAVFTDRNRYVAEHFKEGEEIHFYDFNALDTLNDRLLETLSHEEMRQEMGIKARRAVMKGHTWKQRAETLISKLPPILSAIKEEMFTKK